MQAQVALGAAVDEERTKALRQVMAGCDRAARLIDQMLTLARLDPARADQAFEPCGLGAIVRAVLAEAVPMAVRKSVEVELTADEGAIVIGDPALLAILARNLVDNAVRYGSSGTKVQATVARHRETVELRVADNGPGVPADELGRLGERFYRQPGTQESGSGLGLSIVLQIAAVHRATATFRGAAAGTGLVATVVFPAAVSAPRKRDRAGPPR